MKVYRYQQVNDISMVSINCISSTSWVNLLLNTVCTVFTWVAFWVLNLFLSTASKPDWQWPEGQSVCLQQPEREPAESGEEERGEPADQESGWHCQEGGLCDWLRVSDHYAGGCTKVSTTFSQFTTVSYWNFFYNTCLLSNNSGSF